MPASQPYEPRAANPVGWSQSTLTTKPVNLSDDVLDTTATWHLAWLVAIAVVGARRGNAPVATMRLTGAHAKAAPPHVDGRELDVPMSLSFREATRRCATELFELVEADHDHPSRTVMAELTLHGWAGRATPVRVVMSDDAAPGRQDLQDALTHRDTALWLWLVDASPIGLQVTAEYRRDVFDTRSVRKLLSDVESLLESCQRDPHRPLREFSLAA